MPETRYYKDEDSMEVFDLFEQKLYPVDVVNLIGGDKKEYEFMYSYWMEEKRKYVKEGDSVEFIIQIDGYPSDLIGGIIHKKYTNSVLIKLFKQEQEDKDEIVERLGGYIVVSIKDILAKG